MRSSSRFLKWVSLIRGLAGLAIVGVLLTSTLGRAEEVCEPGTLSPSNQFFFQFRDVNDNLYTPYFSTNRECGIYASQVRAHAIPGKICGCEISLNFVAVATVVLADFPLRVSLYCYDTNSSGVTSRSRQDTWAWQEAWSSSTEWYLQLCEREKQQLISP